jgi:dolichol-phosphate mannosyltransferase
MIYIMLPAYNEELALPPLVARIDTVMKEAGLDYQVVVVNDGSSDATADHAERLSADYPLVCVTHPFNRGLGETARDGFEYVAAHGSPDDIVVRMDCDDTHDPKYILDMKARIDEGWEAVVASRYAPGGGQVGVDWYRRTLSRIANLLMKVCFPIAGVWEYTSGFRGYRVGLLQDALAIYGNKFIDLKGMGFTGTVEKIIKLKMMHARVTEIGFVLRYDRKPSDSKVATSITTLGYFVLIAKYISPWGDEGKLWQKRVAERAARVYGPDGTLRTPEAEAATN